MAYNEQMMTPIKHIHSLSLVKYQVQKFAKRFQKWKKFMSSGRVPEAKCLSTTNDQVHMGIYENQKWLLVDY